MVAVPDNARHHIRLEVVPRRMRCRRHWCTLPVIDAGCPRHLQDTADVLAAYGCRPGSIPLSRRARHDPRRQL